MNITDEIKKDDHRNINWKHIHFNMIYGNNSDPWLLS